MITSEEFKAKLPEKVSFRINFGEPDECWEWTGSLNYYGYGQFKITDGDGKYRSRYRTVHRYVFVELFGEVPVGINICHKCDNRKCCNPNHLFAGTQADNIRDMIDKGRHNPPKGEKQHFSKLNDDKIVIIRKLIASGVVQRVIANCFGVTQTAIYSISIGKTWKHVK